MISAICGFLLILVVSGLIFNRGFRKDLTASEGEASFLNIISIKGVLVLILCGLFVFGMIYPITKDAPSGIDPSKLEDAKQQIKTLKLSTEKLTAETSTLASNNTKIQEKNSKLEGDNFELNKKNKSLNNENEKLLKTNIVLNTENKYLKESSNNRILEKDIPSFVRNLDIDSDISQSLRYLSNSQKGPWSLASDTLEVVISVPGRRPKGRNLSCQKYYNKKVELISNYKKGGQLINGNSTLTVNINGLIAQTRKCRDIYQIDFQLSCFDAQELFSSDVLECDQNDNPLWSEGVPHKLPAFATILQNDTRESKNHHQGIAGN